MKTFKAGEVMATVPFGGGTQYQLLTEEIPVPTKAEKLLRRGSESPHVARLARASADTLIRFFLGQAELFADALLSPFPRLSEEELQRAADILREAAERVEERITNAHGIKPRLPAVCMITEEFRQLIQLFAVLACEEEYCGFVECWETRRWDCRKDCARMKELNELRQHEMQEKFAK